MICKIVDFPRRLFQRDLRFACLPRCRSLPGRGHPPHAATLDGRQEGWAYKLASGTIPEYLSPCARCALSFPTWGGDVLNSHRSFIVQHDSCACPSLGPSCTSASTGIVRSTSQVDSGQRSNAIFWLRSDVRQRWSGLVQRRRC